MKKIYTVLFALMFLASASVFGQLREVCGTFPTADMIQRTLNTKALMQDGFALQFREGVTYVPIKYHLISKLDGSGRISESKVLEMHCELNEQYAEMDIQFYMYQGFDYINNDVAYDNPGDNQTLLGIRKEPRAVNIYIGQNSNPPNQPPIPGSVVNGYFSPGNDWIVIRKSQVNDISNTAPHELGHYFSLLHPHNGWDCTVWDADTHGNPVNITASPCDSEVPIEFVDGSNCEIGGDFLCDTPADYNLGLFDGNDCNYTGPCMDMHGDALMPQEENMMGYFNGCADFVFTAQQTDMVITNLAEREVLGLETDYMPIATSIDDTPTLVSPENGANVAYNVVNFNWEPVAGADRYMLEFDINANFNLIPVRIIVWGTFKSVEGEFLPSNEYFWRVRPLNSYVTCTDFSASGTFNTTDVTSATEIVEIDDMVIAPNPSIAGEALRMTVNATSSFEAEIVLSAIDGRQVWAQNRQFIDGENISFIPTDNLTPGVYVVSVYTETGIMTQRVVVGR